MGVKVEVGVVPSPYLFPFLSSHYRCFCPYHGLLLEGSLLLCILTFFMCSIGVFVGGNSIFVTFSFRMPLSVVHELYSYGSDLPTLMVYL